MNIQEIVFNDVNGDNKKTIDFDNILEQRIKLGKTQLITFISCAILWLADGAEMFVVGFILPVIQKEWKLEDWEVNILGSVVFINWAFGAIFIGQLSDKIGRRKPMIFGAGGQFITAILSAFSPSFIFLVILRGLFGFCLGLTAPISVTNFSETFPKKNRGRFFTAASSFFIIGELVTILMAYVCLDSITEGNWTLLLLWSSVPGGIALILILTTMNESPRYLLLCTEQYDKAFQIINNMIKRNHPKNIYEALKIKNYEEQQVLQWSTTIKLMIMWFSLSIVYYGIMYILPQTLLKMHATDTHKDTITENDDKFEENYQDFLGIATAVLFEIPSALFVIAMIENKKIGRKNFMTLSYGICALFCLCTFFTTEPNSFFFFLVSGAKIFIGFCFAIIYPFTAEIYSTNIRAAGCGLNNSICRVGGALMPFLSFLAFLISNTGPFLIYFIVCLLSLGASYKLSVDTTNLELDKFTEKRREKKISKKLKFGEKLNDDFEKKSGDVVSDISKQSQDQLNQLQPQQQIQEVKDNDISMNCRRNSDNILKKSEN